MKFRWRNTHGNATSVVLIDLEVNSEFYFRMQVFNTAGWGPKGEWRRSETPGCGRVSSFMPLLYYWFKYLIDITYCRSYLVIDTENAYFVTSILS